MSAADSDNTLSLHGSCLCGAVTYRTTREPELCLFCYCPDCLNSTGTDGYAGYMVKDSQFEHTMTAFTEHAPTWARIPETS